MLRSCDVPVAAELSDSLSKPHVVQALQSGFRGIAVALSPAEAVLLRKAIGLGFAAVMPFVAAASLVTQPRVTPSLPDGESDPIDESSLVAPRLSAPDALDRRGAEGVTDLFGNPVSDAVAKYKFDATGTLYELHSPQTELPRLAPPKS